MYQALYRKYRPKNFDDLMGQEGVVKTLKNSIIHHKISHAYLFFGPRGIGKTTVAKVLARAVNCENSIDGNPCENCESCRKSKNLETVDIIEIDAASNNGVDEIREIKSKVNIVPSDLKYKVYIIDEVHMLTSGAFNALLKTLEEPPKHVIFILATTDPQKVSETIVSRCQCYSFKRISIEHIVERLKNICSHEMIQIEDEVLKQIAISSNGGLRDSISSLDKIASFKQGMITLDDYLEMNDLITKEEVEIFTNAILSCDIKEFIIKLNQYYNNGKNLIEIMNQMIYDSKDKIVDYYLKESVLNYSLESYQSLVNLLNEKMFDIKKSANPKIYIELTILKFIENLSKMEKITSKIISREIISENSSSKPTNISQEMKEIVVGDEDRVEESFDEKEIIKQENETPKMTVQVDKEVSNIKEIMRIRLNNALARADKKEKIECEQNFQKLNESVFDQKIGYIVSELLNATIRVVSKDIVMISYEYDSVVDQNLKVLDLFHEVLESIAGISKKIGIITDEIWNTEKQKYIKATKNHEKYDIIEEPELIEMKDSEDSDSSSLLEDFGDIVEIK